MKLILDTGVLIAGDLPPDDAEVAVAAVTFAELEYGVRAASDPTERVVRRARLARLRAALGPGVPFDDRAASAFGELCELEIAAGRSPRARALDLMIAATALAEGAGVFTRNADDFAAVIPLVPIVAP